MSGQCVAKCNGYKSLRLECARDPCMAHGMCKLGDVSIVDCAEWCCQSRGGYVFFIVFFFCAGTCALFSMYYLWRLHQRNVAAGAVTTEGEKIEHDPETDAQAYATQRRRKRQVTVDPQLLRSVGVTPLQGNRNGMA